MSAAENTERLTVNKRELVKILGCSLPTLAQLIDRYPDFPIEHKGSNGKEYLFDAETVTEFLEAKREEDTAAAVQRAALFKQFTLPIDSVAPDEAIGMSPTQRASLAKARLVEHKLARESGLLVPTAEMRQVLTAALGKLGKSRDALAVRIGREFNLPEDVTRGIRAYLDDERRTFVRELRELLAEMDEPGHEGQEPRDGTRG